jgi:hypothetical protein
MKIVDHEYSIMKYGFDKFVIRYSKLKVDAKNDQQIVYDNLNGDSKKLLE